MLIFIFKHFFYHFNELPHTLETLVVVCSKFNSPMDNLPNTLQNLAIFSDIFNFPLANLPSNLNKLKIGCGSFSHNLNNLPKSLHTLIITTNLPHPPNYKTIFDIPLTLPHLGLVFNQQINKFPPNLVVFSPGENYNTFDDLSTSITHLQIGNSLHFLKLKVFICLLVVANQCHNYWW